jgi:S-adenosylmethionine hydrolase
MPIITLSSDWGLNDGSAAVMKARILARNEQITIVDICHNIPPYDQVKASYIISAAWHHFPKGTVHLICFGLPVNGQMQMISLEKDGHYFIGFNDGLFALIFDALPFPVYELPQQSNFSSMMQIMASTAVDIIEGKPLEQTGKALPAAVKKNQFKPVSEEHFIRGKVIMIDRFENAITNITRDFFENAVKENDFEILIQPKGNHRIDRICETYSEVSEGETLARFNSTGNLEIAINRGYASSFLGINEGDGIRIELKK